MQIKLSITVLLLIISIIGILNNNIPYENSFLILLNTILFVRFIKRYPLVSNFAKYVVLITVWMSVVVMPSLHLIEDILGLVTLKDKDYNNILIFGSRLNFILLLTIYIIGRRKNVLQTYGQYHPVDIKDKTVNIVFLITYAVSLFSYTLGLGRMNSEGVSLPFHLSGIINLYRSTFFPAMFALYVENRLIKGKAIKKKYYLLFGLWTLFEAFSILSKSVIVAYAEPVLLMLFFYLKPDFKSIVKVATPVIAVFLLLYPIIGIMRNSDIKEDGMIASIKSSNTVSKENSESSSVLKPLNRTFKISQFAEDYSFINKESIFDFSRLPTLLLMGGSQPYQTRIIDGYPETAVHSSGTSGIMDPILHGGYGLCYIVFILLLLFAHYVDSFYQKQKFGIYIQLILIIWMFSAFVNISYLYNSVGLQSLFVSFVIIQLFNMINYKKKKVK